MKLWNMAGKNELPTISREVEQNPPKKNTRISFPPQSPTRIVPILKYSHSHNFGQIRTPHVPPTIPEVSEEGNPPPLRNGSVRSHTSMTSGGKKVSSRNELTVGTNSYENGSYDGPLPEPDKVSKSSFDVRSTYSNMSSRNPSLQSLQVQREQYCCASKWSPCERKLVALVAVLATVIVILVIVVGYIAGHEDGIDQRFQWNL